MHNKHIDNELDEVKVMDKYESQGYTGSYQMIDGEFTDVNTKKTYSAKEVTIEEEYRFEGETNPEDMSILYVISLADGTKGMALLAYGPTAETEMPMFFKDVVDKSDE